MRAQWYREQANLALQRGHETRDPTLRAGFDELVREWLRLAEQAEWIANQQQQPVAKRTSRRNKIGRWTAQALLFLMGTSSRKHALRKA
jgi:hypothetical protein